MEECNQAYQNAMSVTCPPTEAPTAEPSLYISTASTLTSGDVKDADSNWMFNQQNNNADVQTAFGLNDGNTLAVVDKDDVQEYVVVDSTGRVYQTCIQHGASGTACDADLVCWNGATAGSASEQRSALLDAAVRNDFKSQSCPTIQEACTPIPYNFYSTYFTNIGMPESLLRNMCYSDTDRSMLYVTRDAYKEICVGYIGSGNAQNDLCPTDLGQTYFCSGNNNGLQTFGWPQQFVNSVSHAYSNSVTNDVFNEDMFTHPQCRY